MITCNWICSFFNWVLDYNKIQTYTLSLQLIQSARLSLVFGDISVKAIRKFVEICFS